MTGPEDKTPDETYFTKCEDFAELIERCARENVRVLQNKESESKLDPELVRLLEGHLISCEKCGEFLSFWQEFLRQLSKPSPERDKIDEEIKQYLKKRGVGDA